LQIIDKIHALDWIIYPDSSTIQLIITLRHIFF